ncbi:MAG: hypothetical protein K2Y23_25485 [Cyanobacteria bacterium]|nr:hypothetical protein [Cyanobacteriota bacterium]
MRHLAIVCIVAIASAGLAAQSAGLRVVVIEGEDAVNIIQQKTAVRPVVEVRDRNNLPVPGAIVTFSIEGGKAATFGGASTLTVATNAAGQAAVTGLTPSAAGAFQIQVSAAFQGQVATATIAQTNVMTAAQAAAASASGGSGASGAGGGGLSATTIAVAGAAVAGGAVAATQVMGKDEASRNNFTGTMSGPVVSTIVSRNSGNTCTVNRSVTATVTLKLDTNTATSVSGRLEVQGTDSVVSAGCPVTNQSAPFSGATAVTGTPSNFRGSETRNETGAGVGGETIQGTTTMVFDGSLSGSTVTGTIKWEQKSVSTGGAGGPVDQLANGTFSITLQKS